MCVFAPTEKEDTIALMKRSTKDIKNVVQQKSEEKKEKHSKCALIIIPYFGKLPNYFNLWLKSASFNKTFNWLILTDNDCKEYDVPNNVIIKKCGFEEVVERIKAKFDFKISLNQCYKLCDFKPAYGYIFENEIKGYEFWGYGDIDVILGNLSNFITREILDYYDKILSLGHLSLIRNNEFMNKLFMRKEDGCFYYKDVFSQDSIFAFDEFGQDSLGGHFQICEINKAKVFNKMIYADILYSVNKLKCHFGGDAKQIRSEYSKKHVRFLFKKGSLVQLWKDNQKDGKEVAYIHLQKRKMRANSINGDEFYIYPHKFDFKSRKYCFHLDEFGFQSQYIKNVIKRKIHR